MAADPCPVMRIRARSRAVTGRSIIDRGRRRSIIRSASGTKRGGRNGCRGSHNGAGNREWKQKRVTVKAFLGARSCDRNSDEKSESYACSNYQLSCTHFCLPTFMVNAAFQFDISLTYRHSKLSTLEREKQLTLKFSHANGTRCHPRCCRGCVLPSLLRFAPGLQESGPPAIFAASREKPLCRRHTQSISPTSKWILGVSAYLDREHGHRTPFDPFHRKSQSFIFAAKGNRIQQRQIVIRGRNRQRRIPP